MTNLCLCKRGFFALRDCGLPAEKSCERCVRPICHEHLSPRAEMRLCVECAAREEQPAEDTYDSDWVHGYRHRYYTDSRYQPIYWGSSVGGGGYYDDYDFRSFDTVGDPQVEGDFAGAGAGGDFFDS